MPEGMLLALRARALCSSVTDVATAFSAGLANGDDECPEPEEWAKDYVYKNWSEMRRIAGLGMHLVFASHEAVEIAVQGYP